MRIINGVAMSREMLQGGQNSLGMMRVNEPSRIAGHHGRILRETTPSGTQSRTVGILDVHYRSEIKIDSHTSQLFRRQATIKQGRILVIELTQIFSADSWRKTIIRLQAIDLTAFLIDSNQ